MEYAKLGNTGMDVSRICLGCMGFGDAERWVHRWVLDEENSRPIIKKALELEINFFDTANVYSIGRSIASLVINKDENFLNHLALPHKMLFQGTNAAPSLRENEGAAFERRGREN